MHKALPERAAVRNHALSRRAALTGAAALAAAALPLPALANADADLLAMERRILEMYRRWNDAIGALGEADTAVFALGDEQPDSAAKQAAEARAAVLYEAEGLLCTEVDALAYEMCSMPAATVAGLACKARVALLLKCDELPEMILEELVQLGGRAHA